MATITTVATYDPKAVIVSFGGVIISGYADGSFITIARNGEVFTKRRGSDGSIDRTNKNANDFLVTLTLMQTSSTNSVLTEIMSTDINTNGGVLPLIIFDLRGGLVFTAAQAWIQKDPDDEESDEAGNREWQIATGIAVKYTGGNW
jgi:hypothetical protein